MQFKPLQQLQTVLKQEYYEPTIAWSFRVVLALNIPLIFVPLYKGEFTYEVVWMAFGAYIISLLDYRGLHYRKIVIQFIEAVLITAAAIVGMNTSNTWAVAVVGMFIVGLFAALIRNWSDYGASIGVGVGFFYLFGLSTPVSTEISFHYGLYVFLGALWAITITALSFPFRPSNPVRRSVAKIWKSTTEFLDVIIEKHTSSNKIDALKITQKEMAIRTTINQSIELFSRRDKKPSRLNTAHYDLLMEIRRETSLFAANINTIHEVLETINFTEFQKLKQNVLYKLLSSYGQASARISIVLFTFRTEDYTMASIRVKRCEIALQLFEEACSEITINEIERQQLNQLIKSCKQAYSYLKKVIDLVEKKLNIKKSDYLENYKLSFNNFLIGLKPRVITDLFREAFNINSQHFIYALRVATGLSIGVFIFKFFKIDHGHWIALTMLIVIQPYFGATKKKSFERIIGTVSGIVLGGAIMLLPLPHEAFVALLVLVSFLVAYYLRNNYKVGVFFVTIMMVVLMQISQQGTWQLIGWRVLSTVIGAVLAIISSYVFWPIWESKRFPVLLKKTLLQNQTYLQHVLQLNKKRDGISVSWNKHRRLAEAANNEVFASIQRMVEEPEHIQSHVDIYFSISGVLIRLTREITSIGLIYNSNLFANDTKNKIPLIYKECSEMIQWVVNHLQNSVIQEKIPDFKLLRTTIQSLQSENDTDNFIKTELEKIAFELESLCVLIRQKKYTN
jgi:uncharacterized membrane protein YccC